jgi:Asp-tRNA(Asn)/Glu-tRNA(Gln) amidotransferase A subunit family amidase
MIISRESPPFPPKSAPQVCFTCIDVQKLKQTSTLSWWGYLAQWNLLDYPAIVLPVTSVQSSIDVPNPSYQPINEIDRENHDIYDPSVFENAPVGVQLIGRSMQEEQLLAFAMAVDNAVKT